jgi:DNA-binding Lrp family transcriptional regulator
MSMIMGPGRLVGRALVASACVELRPPMVWAYVFIDTVNPGPKRVCREIRKLAGVVRADALLGTPDVLALVAGDDIAGMDAVIDRIVEIEGVVDSETKVARWIDDS